MLSENAFRLQPTPPLFVNFRAAKKKVMTTTPFFKLVHRIARFREQELRCPEEKRDSVLKAVCDLCLHVRHPKAFSRHKNICLSCSMRDMNPRWVNIDNGKLAAIRKCTEMELAEFADMSGWLKARQSRLEMQKKMNLETSRAVARTLTQLAIDGKDISAAVKLWPLFCVLVPPEMIDAMSR